MLGVGVTVLVGQQVWCFISLCAVLRVGPDLNVIAVISMEPKNRWMSLLDFLLSFASQKCQ